MRLCILVLLFVLSISCAPKVEHCDIFIAGGSTAALAAAWTAAELSPQSTVCLTEPTDWLGGQMTSSGVSGIDYGTDNNPALGHDANLPKAFQMLAATFPKYSGGCWVSSTCYLPKDLIDKFIVPHTNGHKNLKVYYNTVISKTEKNTSNGNITSVTAIQRTPKSGTTGWELPLSAMISDWYTPSDSSLFTKDVLLFSDFKVIIEATEFGDVLMTGGIPTHQGIEIPVEHGSQVLDTCGQATIFPFFMNYNTNPPSDPWVPPPGCAPCTSPNTPPGCCDYFVEHENVKTWSMVWTYRRAVVTTNHSMFAVNPGDISQQNWDAQDSPVYQLLTLADARKQVRTGWMGGLNITAIRMNEQRAYGWFHYYVANASEEIRPYLFMNQSEAGGLTGLAKLPYMRDTRRSAGGLGGFRLLKAYLAGVSPQNEEPLTSAPNRGFHFADTIGIGTYFYADVHPGLCDSPLPKYIRNHTIYPYYIPFRALTVDHAPNLLVAGKSMSQSFLANAGTRLHPEEWVTGTAAGAASALMLAKNWLTTDVYANIQVLQNLLKTVGQPLEWTLP